MSPQILEFHADRALVIGMQFYHLAKVLLALYNPHHANGINFLHLARSIEVSKAPYFSTHYLHQ
jgi:hypothetical protein